MAGMSRIFFLPFFFQHSSLTLLYTSVPCSLSLPFYFFLSEWRELLLYIYICIKPECYEISFNFFIEHSKIWFSCIPVPCSRRSVFFFWYEWRELLIHKTKNVAGRLRSVFLFFLHSSMILLSCRALARFLSFVWMTKTPIYLVYIWKKKKWPESHEIYFF